MIVDESCRDLCRQRFKVKHFFLFLSISIQRLQGQRLISYAQLDKNLVSRSSDLLFLADAMNPKQGLLVVMANEKIYPFLADENLDFRRLEPFTIPYWQDHTRFLGGHFCKKWLSSCFQTMHRKVLPA